MNVRHSRPFFIFNKGLYNVSSDLVSLDEKDRPELFFFENSPTPLNVKNSDQGSAYLDERLASNLLEQLIPQAKQGGGLGELFDFLFSDPRRVVFLILAASVLWAIVSSGGV